MHTNVDLSELGIGASMILWGFRAIANGKEHCSIISEGYSRALGDYGPYALRSLRALTRTLGHHGNRRISVSLPGCSKVTSDEISLVAAISSIQNGELTECTAHLSWLLAGADKAETISLCSLLGRAFLHAKIAIKKPSIEISCPNTLPANVTVLAVGQA